MPLVGIVGAINQIVIIIDHMGILGAASLVPIFALTHLLR